MKQPETTGYFPIEAMKKPTTQSDDLDLAAAKQNPLTWMLTMESARQRGDFLAALAARQRLEQLGIRVTYGEAAGKRRQREASDA